MFKNVSANQLILFIYVAIIAFALAILFIFFEPNVNRFNLPSVMLFILCAVALFFFIRYLLVQFLFSKVNLIYKIISRTRGKKNEVDINRFASKSSLEEVREHVNEWADSYEQELVNLKELETYRRNFVSNLSHELKTPLFSIQGYLYTLLEGGMDDDRINHRYIAKALSNVDRLEEIVSDLAVINSLESGGVLFDMEPFDIKELIKEAFQDFEILAKEKEITLSFDPSAQRNYQVVGDKDSIRRVLDNLIGNSIKYTQPNGKTIASLYDYGDNVLVEITDQGIGIPDKDLNHVFDRFYRVETSRNRDVGGSGLGLSIVKNIMEAHDQEIHVRSKVGDGTTFGFTLKKAGV